jgi:hypothetical protein
VDVRFRGRHLAQAGHAAAQPVDVLHGEGEFRLVRGGEQMQHRVGRAAHGNVERHGVFEGLKPRNGARQHGFIVLLVITPRQVDDQVAGLQEQAPAVGVGCQHRAVARQGEPQRLGQAVHGIGREHARAGAAGGAGRTLDDRHVGFAHLVVDRGDHGVDQVQRMLLAVLEHHLARLHRPARDEDRRDVEAQGGHQHARRDLVAVGDADHGVGAMGVDHVFHAVGDDLARGQRIEHAVVAHRDAVVDRDGVELLGDTARLLDLPRDHLAQVHQVDMARHELREGIDDGDDRLAEIAILHARRTPQPARAGHIAAMGGGPGTIGRHDRVRRQ